jgi:hypothetical protein
MNDETLQKLIAEIDGAPRDAAPQSHISVGKPQGYIFVIANRAGLIQLARAFLTAALTPIDSEVGARPTQIDESLSQVHTQPGDLVIGWIEHSESVPISEPVIANRKRQAWKNDGFMTIGCFAMGIAGLFLMISGLIFWIALVAGLWK